MLSIQKSPHDKTSLGYVASSSDIPSSSKTIFVPPTVLEHPPVIEDKQKEKVNDDVPGTQQPYSIRRLPICHHCGLSEHIRPQYSLLKAQKAKAKKEVPRQAQYGTVPAAQHQKCLNRDSTFRVMSEDFACESEEFQVPCQPSGRCVIPSGLPSVYGSIRPDDVSFRLDIKQPSIICPDDVLLPSGHLHRIEKLLCQLSPSGRFTARPDAYQFSNGSLILSQFEETEDQSTVRTMWYPVRMRISVRQESQFKMDRLDV